MQATPESYKLLCDGSKLFARMEQNGIRVDTKYLDKRLNSVDKDIAKAEAVVKSTKVYARMRHRYKKVSLQAPQQLASVVFGEMGFKPKLFTDTGQFQSTEAAFSHVNLKIIKPYFHLKRLYKARQFLRNIKKEVWKGYVHPFFNMSGGGGRDEKGGARTYRSTSDHPNFMNFPVRVKWVSELIRQCFIARKGCRLVEIDYKQLEVMFAACYHKDPTMLKYLHNPKMDMHYDMAQACYMLGHRDMVSKDTRYCAKNKYVFPEFYGSYFKKCAPALWNAIDSMNLVVEGTETSLKEHLRTKGITKLGKCDKELRSVPGTFEHHIMEVEKHFWEKRFPVYAQWKIDWYEAYLKNGFFQMLSGFVVQGYYARNDVINYPVQGVAFHCLLWSLIEIQKWIVIEKKKTLIVGEIHDSGFFDVPEEELQEFLMVAEELMTKAIRRHWSWIIVPLEIEVEIPPAGGNWFQKEKWEKSGDKWGPKQKRAA